jgi:RNA polymerase sigma factor (sigma-70 family)
METAMTHTAVAQSMDDRLQREFDELVYRHYQQAYNLAYRLTGNAADAEDLVQEAFLRAYRFFDRYDRSMPFMNWFSRILTNLYIDEYRRRGRLRTVSIDEVYSGEDGEEGTTMDLPDTAPTRWSSPQQRVPPRHPRGTAVPLARVPHRRYLSRLGGLLLRGNRRNHQDLHRHGALAHPSRAQATPRPHQKTPSQSLRAR